MTSHSELDPIAILAALGVDKVISAVPITGGLGTLIWRVESGNEMYALRVFLPEQADIYQREGVAMLAAAEAGIPVPHVHAIGMWRDRPALLLSWCQGDPLLHELERRPWRCWALAVEYGRVHAAINAVAAPLHLEPHPVSWIDWAGPDEGPLQSRLRTLKLDPPVLLHLDYHPLNVLTIKGKITGVLDWTNVRVGDPRADFARTYVYLCIVPVPDKMPPWVRLGRWVFVQGWQHGYRQVAGPIGDMALFYAWAGAVAAHDLAAKVGQPDSWIQLHHIEAIRHWTDTWKRRIGIL